MVQQTNHAAKQATYDETSVTTSIVYASHDLVQQLEIKQWVDLR
jgi:hypothetical protein